MKSDELQAIEEGRSLPVDSDSLFNKPDNRIIELEQQLAKLHNKLIDRAVGALVACVNNQESGELINKFEDAKEMLVEHELVPKNKAQDWIVKIAMERCTVSYIEGNGGFYTLVIK